MNRPAAAGSHPLTAAQAHYVELASNFDGVKRVLDAPAGTGVISRALAARGYHVTAAEIERDIYSAHEVPCTALDLNATLPFDDASFDLVLCREGIEHLENQFATVREFHRVVRPKGYLLVSTPNLLTLRARFSNLLVGGHKLRFRPPPDHWPHAGADHINLHDYYTLRAVLARSGFRVLDATSHARSPTSIFLAPLVPFIWFFTRRALRRKAEGAQREVNREIQRHLLSRDLLFGKKLILLAQREG